MTEFWEKVGKTVRYHGRRALCAVRGVWWDLRRPLAVRPVIVVGCSRAGTTLVYKIFSESRELASLQKETHDFWSELHPLAARDWRSHVLGAEYASQGDREQVSRYFYTHSGALRFVDKNNQNGLCIPYLHALFPDAHFVYVKRSPGDNVNSLIEGWGKPDQFATWSDELPASVAVDGGRYRYWCFFLPEDWRDYLTASIEDVCAYQYIAMNEAILAAREQIPKHQWTEIRYEDLLRDPMAEFRRAFLSTGLRFDESLERNCAKVLSRPYNAFSEIRLDKWRDGRNHERIEFRGGMAE